MARIPVVKFVDRDSRNAGIYSRGELEALQNADVAIDCNNVVFKHRTAVEHRQATEEELAEAVEVRAPGNES